MSSVADPTPAPQPPAVTEPEGEFRPPSADASAIRLDSLRKVFGSGDDAVVAVDGIDLDIVDGEFLTLLGPQDRARPQCFA